MYATRYYTVHDNITSNVELYMKYYKLVFSVLLATSVKPLNPHSLFNEYKLFFFCEIANKNDKALGLR